MSLASEAGFGPAHRGELARLTLRRCPDDAATRGLIEAGAHSQVGCSRLGMKVGFRHIGRAAGRRPLRADHHLALCAALGVDPVSLAPLENLARHPVPISGPLNWASLGLGLALRRELDGLSVRAAATRLGISPATFIRAEQGRVVSFDALVRLAGFLGLHPHDFTARPTPAAGANPHEAVADGWSANTIGARLGVTRNAVLGKAMRLGLTLGRGRAAANERDKIATARAALLAPPSKPRPPAKPAPAPVVVNRIRAREAEARREVERGEALQEIRASTAAGDFPHKTTLFGLERDQCRFPLWPNLEQPPVDRAFYCGAPRRDETCSYCPGHAALTSSGLSLKSVRNLETIDKSVRRVA